jgi:NAD(P)-dependent dehydrogenase (short-subunit alcohol dehydrogenase family)
MAIALVTGTSTGIGLATAITLGRAGHTVYAGMRSLEGAQELRTVADAEKLPVTPVQLDVNDEASVKTALGRVLAASSHIDVLVNNAGIGGNGPVAETPLEGFAQVMQTNFFGALRCIKMVLPGMIDRRGGTIVNVTSVSGRVAGASQGPYVASKFALEGLSETLAQEMKTFNIRVAIVEPGVTATPIFSKAKPPSADPAYPHQRRLQALFGAMMNPPTSPYVVGQQIREIVEGNSWQLRYPTGADASVFLNFRASISDEEWVAFGALSDAEWTAGVKHYFGLDVTP